MQFSKKDNRFNTLKTSTTRGTSTANYVLFWVLCPDISIAIGTACRPDTSGGWYRDYMVIQISLEKEWY